MVAPEFSYDLTPARELRRQRQPGMPPSAIRTDIPDELVSYNSPEVDLGLTWALSAKSRVERRPYYAYYDPITALTARSNRHAYRDKLQLPDDKFSAVSKSKLTVKVERDTSQPAAFGLPSSQPTCPGDSNGSDHHKFLTSNGPIQRWTGFSSLPVLADETRSIRFGYRTIRL